MRFIFITLLLFASITANISYSEPQQNGYQSFASVPILQNGRIKPLDSFARSTLLSIYGKNVFHDKINNQKLSATIWLTELLLNPQNAYKRAVFNISNPNIVHVLGLQKTPKHLYSFAVLTKAIKNKFKTIDSIAKMPAKQRSQEQQQLVDIYIKTINYFQISRSLSLIWPTITTNNKHLSNWLNIKQGENYSYVQLIRYQRKINEKIKLLKQKTPSSMNEEEKELVAMWYKLSLLKKDEDSKIFTIIPAQWDNEKDWYSPWQMLNNGKGSPLTAEYLNIWQNLAGYYQSGDMKNWNKIAIKINEFSLKLSPIAIQPNILKLEVLYNILQPFKASLWLYIITLVSLMFSVLFWHKLLTKTAVLSLTSGALIHFIGLVGRMVIMNRPPVTTLYESIIFVALIGVIFALIIERKKRDKIGLIIGSILGASLQFIGMRYASEGDTLGMLSAVLNTNFWLATHVVTITIAYGCCLVGGVLGHIYLIQKSLKYKTNRLNDLMRNMLAVSLVALFFAVLGTILGGIWADQSWGRFWGWDPKENGAMLICLWLIWVVHGRITGFIKPFGFAISMIITNIIIALAWFGVNLLGVGLHSYGFTSGIAMNLALFCGAELLFIFILVGYILYNKPKRLA